MDPMRVETALLSDQVYAQLRQRILAGEFAPGERLVESDLARRMGISQSPVRDGLRKLTESGLTRYEPRRGTFVEGISAKDAADAYHVRVALEPLAARELLSHLDDAVLAELQGVADAMLTAAQDGDLARVLEQDIAFHRIVWWRSQNDILPKVWPMVEKIWPLLEARVRNSADKSKPLYYSDLEEVALTHQPLVDALRKQDPATPDLFLEHVTQVWSKVENLGR